MTAAAAESVLTLQELRNRARLLERGVLGTNAATEEQLDSKRPADTAAVHLWLEYFGWLSARLEHGAMHVAAAAGSRPLAQILHESLADTPAAARLHDGTIVRVHPKSIDTLLFLEALDADLVSARGQLAELLELETADELPPEETQLAGARFLERLLQRSSIRYFVWILTHEGPGLPFSEDEAEPALPEWTATLRASDLDRLYRAHLQVNRDDLEFLSAAFPSDVRESKSRLPLSGFLGAMAHEWALDSRHVLRERSVRSLFAQAIAAAQSHREARAATSADRRA